MRWIRPVISLIGFAGVTVGFFLQMVSPEVYVPLVTMTLIYWFKSRDDEKEKNGEGEK